MCGKFAWDTRNQEGQELGNMFLRYGLCIAGTYVLSKTRRPENYIPESGGLNSGEV